MRLAYITLFEIVEKCVIYIEINAAPRIKVNSIRFAPHIYIIHKRKQHKRNVRGFFTLARYHKKNGTFGFMPRVFIAFTAITLRFILQTI